MSGDTRQTSDLPGETPRGETLRGKTLFITGASRGIGLAIGLRAARDGANIAVAAKTDAPHPRLPGTVHSAADEIRQAGGAALPLVVDVRDEAQVEEALSRTAEHFGGIDIVVNNASAIQLTDTPSTEMKRFDLMHQVNARATFLMSKLAIPHLERSANPHILTLSPPLDLRPDWFAPHLAYTMAKYGISLCMLGLAEELRGRGIAANALWPLTTFATAAVRNVLGGDAMMRASRTPDIVADAAYRVFLKRARDFTGRFLIDETFLREEGVSDVSAYRVDPGTPLQPDLFVDPALVRPAEDPAPV